MSRTPFYTDRQREMQRAHGAERLARTVAQAIVWTEIDGKVAGFIQSRDFFFLATVDGEGRPTVSYKGGPPGVVRVEGPAQLSFPLYDGNGMFLSAGNMAETGEVGLLFMDFETPNRIRVQGRATVMHEPSARAPWPGARLAVGVAVSHVFLNCARYVHPHRRVATSPYIPAGDGAQPHPAWKRIDFVQDALPEVDRERTTAAGGTIDMAEYERRLMAGIS